MQTIMLMWVLFFGAVLIGALVAVLIGGEQ